MSDIFEEFKAAARFVERVDVSEEQLQLVYRDGSAEEHSFASLRKVTLITTDEGPALDDVFWLMMFDSIIMIPQGIPGEQELLGRLQQLPGFDNEAVIAAMGSAENDAFQVYERGD